MPAQSPLARFVASIIDAWALRKGIVYRGAERAVLEFDSRDSGPSWVSYLLVFDLKYRVRRLRFMIEGQNRLYQLIGQEGFAGFDPSVVDRLKREFYDRLEKLRQRERGEFYSTQVRALVADIFPPEPSPKQPKQIELTPP